MLVSHFIIKVTNTCGSGIRESPPGDWVFNETRTGSLWKVRKNNLNYKYITQFSIASPSFHTLSQTSYINLK